MKSKFIEFLEQIRTMEVRKDEVIFTWENSTINIWEKNGSKITLLELLNMVNAMEKHMENLEAYKDQMIDFINSKIKEL